MLVLVLRPLARRPASTYGNPDIPIRTEDVELCGIFKLAEFYAEWRPLS